MKKIILILLYSHSIMSQVALLDTNTMLIGDQITLNITSTFEKDEEYKWPIFTDTISKNIEVISQNDTIIQNEDSSITRLKDVIISSFDSGTYNIGPFIFNKDKQTKLLMLNVQTLPMNDSSQMIDITNTKIGDKSDFNKEELKEINKKRWKKILLILIIILIIFTIYYLIKKYKKEGTFFTPKKIVPAHITALNKIQNLKKKKLWQKGEIKEYYSEISFIIREYIENRYMINALELPTSDIMRSLKIEKNIKKNLQSILEKADNIKYAKGLSLEKENIEALDASIQFIKDTKLEDEENNK